MRSAHQAFAGKIKKQATQIINKQINKNRRFRRVIVAEYDKKLTSLEDTGALIYQGQRKASSSACFI